MAARGDVKISNEECKGCGLCVESCPPEVLLLATGLNRYGVHPAQYKGDGCTGCGSCEQNCPTYPKSIAVIPKSKRDLKTV